MSAELGNGGEEESFYSRRKSQLNVIFSVLGTPEEVENFCYVFVIIIIIIITVIIIIVIIITTFIIIIIVIIIIIIIIVIVIF